MEEIYGFHQTISYSEQASESLVLPPDYHGLLSVGAFRDLFPIFGSNDLYSEAVSIMPEIQERGIVEGDEMSNAIKAKIASHPRYPTLLEAYIDCQKVGAPPEISCLLDELRRENDVCKRTAVSTRLGADPELDEFMETFCDILVKYKSDLARPFDEATTFLNKIEMQLSNLCKGASGSSVSGTAVAFTVPDPFLLILKSLNKTLESLGF